MAENLEQINRDLMNHTELDPELGQTYSHGFFGRDDLNAIYGGVGFVQNAAQKTNPHVRCIIRSHVAKCKLLTAQTLSQDVVRYSHLVGCISPTCWEALGCEQHAEYLEASVGLEQTLEQTLDEEILNVESVGSSVLLESVSKLVSEELSTSEGILVSYQSTSQQ